MPLIDDADDAGIGGRFGRQEGERRLLAADEEDVLADAGADGVDCDQRAAGRRPIGRHRLQDEQLVAGEIQRRWPAMCVPEELVGVFERRAGLLHVESCVAAALDAARRAGGQLLTGVEVHGWRHDGDICVQTAAGEFRTARLLIAAGAVSGPRLVTA